AARLCLGGQTSLPFTLRTFPPTAITDAASVGEVVAASREHFGAEQADIDARLERVLGVGSAKDLESGGEFDAAWVRASGNLGARGGAKPAREGGGVGRASGAAAGRSLGR